MKIQILSDLHFEFHKDDGKEFIDSLKGEADVLLLAGDICAHHQIVEVMGRFCEKYPSVLYVHGNHEFYGTDRKTVVEQTLLAEAANERLLWLDCDQATVNEQEFIGTPLWFARDPSAPKWAMNDFTAIQGYTSWVYRENDSAKEVLYDDLKPHHVVITHHLPSEKSVHQMFKGSPLNAFFLCQLDMLIKSRQPKLWVHGHTHFSMDYKIGPTRVVCNPFGYPHQPNPKFNDNLIIEV